MYTAVRINLNSRRGKSISFDYDYDNEIEVALSFPDDCEKSCTDIQTLMALIDRSILSDGDTDWTLRKTLEDFRDEEEIEEYDVRDALGDYDDFVRDAVKMFSDFKKLKSAEIQAIGYGGPYGHDENVLDSVTLNF